MKVLTQVIKTGTSGILNDCMRKILVLLILVASLLVVKVKANSYSNVTISDAETMIDSNPSLVILDVRTQSEYNEGHIRSAKLIPRPELEGRLNELNKTDKILVYCKTGVRSAQASQILNNNGFLYVFNMVGGITEWIDKGNPVYIKYSSIQQAINNANERDTMFVSSGIYYESIVVNKSLTLKGENKDATIIDGGAVGQTAMIVADSVILDGFTIRNAGSIGIRLEGSDCIIGNNILNNQYTGILLEWDSNNNTVAFNRITDMGDAGIDLRMNFNNTLWANYISNGKYGIAIYDSDKSGNIINCNTLSNNTWNLYFPTSSGITFYWNNFFKKDTQVLAGYENVWDSGYPSGGNYWSDYNGTDLYSGPYENETGSDGIGDTSYRIDPWMHDRYPLTAPINIFDISTWDGEAYYVNVVSNSTVSNFKLGIAQKMISFNVTGYEFASGFCRIAIPIVVIHNLWDRNYAVLLNSEPWPFRNWTDDTNTYIYINYTHSDHRVIIIPEFPSFLILPLFMIATVLAVIVYKRKHSI